MVDARRYARANADRDPSMRHVSEPMRFERAKLVRRVGELHAERREQLAEITVREMGTPNEQALDEIDFCVDIYGYYADNGPDLMKDEPIDCSPVRLLSRSIFRSTKPMEAAGIEPASEVAP